MKMDTYAEPLAENLVQPSINPENVAYCPTMDLIALATVDDQVQVYRLNGQRVFSVHNKQTNVRICKIKWKSNGESSRFLS